MAERRMFAKTIIDSDAFLEMPPSTQALYFHLSMRADDEGFLNNPKKIMRVIGAREDDMNVLIAKKFIIAFDTGVIVVKHWRMHNYIRKDRFKSTVHIEEKSKLGLKENGAYTLSPIQPQIPCNDIQDEIDVDFEIIPQPSNHVGCISDENVGQPYDKHLATDGQPDSDQLATQVRLGKVRLGKVSIVAADKQQQEEAISIFKYYEMNVGSTTPILNERLADWQSSFTDEMIKLAIDKAIMANVRNMKYITSILNNWHAKGIKTPLDVENEEKSFKDKKNTTSKSIGNYGKTKFANFQQRTDIDYDEIERKLTQH